MDLDDLEEISRIDRSGMLEILEEFPQQIEEGMKIGEIEIDKKINKIMIAGMGGSAISGDILQCLKPGIPIFTNRDYLLPRFVDDETLVISVSYSGDTEEAISSFLDAFEKGCQIISISSGGKLEELSRKADHYIKIKKGLQPRAALPFLLFPIISLLEKNGFLKMDGEVEEAIEIAESLKEKIKKGVSTERNMAKKIAKKIYGKMPRIYGNGIFSVAAKRWESQFNENSKIFAFSYEVPECDHNEIVGWSTPCNWYDEFVCIFLRSDESPRIRSRMDFMKKIFEKCSDVIEVIAEGKCDLAKMIYSIYLGDYVSCYLALLRNIDPTPVDIIQELKRKLGKSARLE